MDESFFTKVFSLLSLLQDITDYNETLRLVTEQAGIIFNAAETSVIMVNPRTDKTIKTIYSNQEDLPKIKNKLLHELVTGWVIKNNKSFLSSENPDSTEITNMLELEKNDITLICSPLKNSGKTAGVIFLTSKAKELTYTKDHLLKLEDFCSVVSPFLVRTQDIHRHFVPVPEENILMKKYAELGLMGRSKKFLELLRSIEIVSRCSVRVMLQGKSGTGKELAAKAIHHLSDRSGNKFVAVDCGAIPSHLIESEMFGHKKGAFTGAITDRIGLFEAADTGTLFMDEVTNLTPEMQVKLLRVLQEEEIRPLGSNDSIKIDVRIITASSADIKKLVQDGKFREDLYYRLFVYPIYIPSLNERIDDIDLLVDHFVHKFCNKQKRSIPTLEDELMSALQNHDWKGNIRELENMIELLVTLLPPDSCEIVFEQLPEEIRRTLGSDDNRSVENSSSNLTERLNKYEANIIQEALTGSEWNQSEAARKLEIPEQTLRYKMKKLNITKNLSDYS